MKQEILRGKYPPNFKEIVAVIPQARKPGVIFSYGDKIYAPPGYGKITTHLIRHEAVHGERQLAIGVEIWWRMYLQNRQFRYDEELLAHREEYLSMIDGTTNEQWKKNCARMIAMRLASPLYGAGKSIDECQADILK